MNIKDHLPNPDQFREPNGKHNWWAWAAALLVGGTIIFALAMWKHQILMHITAIFHSGATPSKVVRPINEDGEPVADIILSDGQRVWEQNSLHEFAIEHTYRGKTLTVNQIQPQEPVATLVINFEPVQDVVLKNRHAKFVDETGSPMPNLDVRVASESAGQSDASGMLKINHRYCNQFIEAYCSRCNKLLCRQPVSHLDSEQRIVVPQTDLLFRASAGSGVAEVQFKAPDGSTNTWLVNEPSPVSGDWCGETIAVWLPGRIRPVTVLVRHKTPIDVDSLIRRLSLDGG